MIEKVIQKFFGKKNFHLDQSIPKSYLIGLSFKYTFSLLRGNWNKLFFGKNGHRVFIEGKVKLISRKKMFLGENVRIGKNTVINAISYDGVTLADNVKIGENNHILVTGSLQEIGKGIRIGKNTSFSENTFFGAAGGIEIGSNVISGQNVRFHAENHIFSDTSELIRKQGVTHKGIKIGNNCWIGSGVVFLDGAVVGDGCVIAANAVVGKTFSDNIIIGGVPAKQIKKR
ncbi:acyltransferase [Loigolactobacillus coryniformis]|uniref:acyltransferase n=1 Tax=Lactobacillaceae TaxID=33958 RepID=UPI0023417396|nr:DapH/DapD/GlmU-related protein [Loigolactobacillus coryniformis]MDC4185953.1 acyltransferase [Loigolactobacillus coryniformis]